MCPAWYICFASTDPQGAIIYHRTASGGALLCARSEQLPSHFSHSSFPISVHISTVIPLSVSVSITHNVNWQYVRSALSLSTLYGLWLVSPGEEWNQRLNSFSSQGPSISAQSRELAAKVRFNSVLCSRIHRCWVVFRLRTLQEQVP